MGGAILTFEGKTPEEVKERLDAQLRLARDMGLYVEAQTKPAFDKKNKVWRAGVKVHT